LIGNQGLKNEGAKQNEEGKRQEAQGQLNDFGGGIGGFPPLFYPGYWVLAVSITDGTCNSADRAKGAVGNAASAIVGDREGQARYQEMHDKGKTQQRSAEYDIQKQGEA
jgi:hypothetical protein